MNVYLTGYGKHTGYVAAENEDAAVKAFQEKTGINYLPFTAKKIEVEGYTIKCVKEGEKGGAGKEGQGTGKGSRGTKAGSGDTGQAQE